MERQTVHRILGIFVVIALVIILLPLFQSNKELSTEAALIAAPPFPDRPAEVTSTPESAPASSAISNSATIKTNSYRIIEDEKITSVFKKSAKIDKHIPGAKAQTITAIKSSSQKLIKNPVKPFDDEGLLKLKSTVWVVQIGSFKNKKNALRIVNQLRASGYHAFIQEITTAMEDTTRVYVGPERKQTTARALADRIQGEMHLKGLVISDKPLTL